MLNPRLKKTGLPKVSKPKIDVLVQGVLAGDLASISRAITLCESQNPSDLIYSKELIQCLYKPDFNSYRLGITGVPGVGKSTFIESFGQRAIEAGHKVAVLSIDPSSAKSGGSILGDKTRMELLSRNPKAYVRPSASGTHLGGVARNTRESIIICEAAGFDLIIVETVGVGQSEIEALHLTDFFLLLMLSGAGDELQGIKRGIMETADGILITKADGPNVANAKRAAQEYKRALHLLPPHEGDWIPKVDVSSALEKSGLDTLLKWMKLYKNKCWDNGYWQKKRQNQALYWFDQQIQAGFLQALKRNSDFNTLYTARRKEVENLQTDPFQAVEGIVEAVSLSLKK
jgi:LAO/AO transport system kinase